MALRLVKTSAPEVPSNQQPSPSQVLAALSQRADAVLRAHDAPGWRALLDATADTESPHLRYASRRLLLERVLAVTGVPGNVLAALYATAARGALDLLDEEPREPLLLNLAGVFTYELGAFAPAEALFRAALRLDPDLPHAERNATICRKRRKAGAGPSPALPPQIVRELRAMGGRAQRIAARAKPAHGLTLSLCMIVKDEEAMLPRSLAATRPFVDEIVVVDTGSTDRTVEIAESFGAHVLHHAWTGDFSQARNVSFEAATSDWVMYLDADEVLVAEDGERLRALTGRVWREAFFLLENNHTGDLEDGTSVTHNALRVFRNRPEYRFKDRIHEQIAWSLPDLPERLETTTVRVEHFGYLGAVRDAKEKSRRNIELLRRQVDEGADHPFLHFNLGSELAAAGDVAGALHHLERSWQGLQGTTDRTKLGFFPSMAARYVKALRHAGRHEDALATGDRVLEILPGFTDVVFEQGMVHSAAGRLEEALACFRRCVEMGDAPSKYSAAVGAGSFSALVAQGQVLERLGRHAEAAAVLRRSLEEHPGFVGAVDPFARTLLRTGTPAAEAAAAVRELLGAAGLTPSARFLLAVPLFEAGATAEAEVEFRALLEAQPSAHTARVALAEALLSQGRLAEAAAAAGAVPADAPCAPAAARTLLFAVLASGADGGEAFAFADAAGLPHPELAVFRAWRDGGGLVPGEAAGLLTVMLEALAHLEDFDAFERLAALVESVDVPWRERRELLAGVYLRRGFLESAAEEWIAAVQREGADERALRGLAAIAEQQGLTDDAAVFRAEAEALTALA